VNVQRLSDLLKIVIWVFECSKHDSETRIAKKQNDRANNVKVCMSSKKGEGGTAMLFNILAPMGNMTNTVYKEAVKL
jgi:hypothetical protein